MADVCEKHNIKLLTYGTFVRSTVLSSPPQAPILLLPLSQLAHVSLLPPDSAAAFSQTPGLTSPSLIRIPAR